MNAVQLQQAVTISVTKQVQEVAQAQAAILLEGLASATQNVQAVQASHPTLGRAIDIRA